MVFVHKERHRLCSWKGSMNTQIAVSFKVKESKEGMKLTIRENDGILCL